MADSGSLGSCSGSRRTEFPEVKPKTLKPQIPHIGFAAYTPRAASRAYRSLITSKGFGFDGLRLIMQTGRTKV